MGGEATNDDWTGGPAKWAAVLVLGAAATAGLAWSLLRPHGPPVIRPVAGAGAALGAALDDRTDGFDAAEASKLPEESRSARGEPAGKPTFSGTLNINTATAAELEALPGIGPALAGRIIEDRAARGPFRSVDDLDRVRGIGPKTLERLRPHLRVE